ncbi:DUF6301 family protein [Microbacterium sp. BWT-B31]|uniref:DUF6301 family protein n=1 Tax=Microbacterium sp. BWT-B31 TaxID=3232072 RepID=UPI003528CD73
MGDFRVLSASEIRPVLTTLNGLNWPIRYDEFPRVFELLGWEKQRRKGGATNLPVSLPLVSVGELGGEVAEFSFRVSDTLPGDDRTNRTVVARHFPDAVAAVSECLHADPDSEAWATNGVRWDLEGGRQINLLSLDDTVIMQYWSRRMADVERFERNHGVDPSNNLDASD